MDDVEQDEQERRKLRAEVRSNALENIELAKGYSKGALAGVVAARTSFFGDDRRLRAANMLLDLAAEILDNWG